MSETVNIYEAKTRLSQLVDLAAGGEEVTRRKIQAGDRRTFSKSVRISQMLALEALPPLHGDLFDRLLIAQSITEHRRLVTHDAAILAYASVRGFDPLAI